MLLVSGGETLDPSSRVARYSAGTDTNPIFMFSSDLEQRNPPAPWPSIENGKELKIFSDCVQKSFVNKDESPAAYLNTRINTLITFRHRPKGGSRPMSRITCRIQDRCSASSARSDILRLR